MTITADYSLPNKFIIFCKNISLWWWFVFFFFLQSWEAVDRDASTFTPDITPLILAAHRDNYEILKILLDRGATLPAPHDIRCACSDCVRSCSHDSLNHSRSRINAYRALASPSLIALSSKDPILTAFELSFELRRLSFLEHEYKCEYTVRYSNFLLMLQKICHASKYNLVSNSLLLSVRYICFRQKRLFPI